MAEGYRKDPECLFRCPIRAHFSVHVRITCADAFCDPKGLATAYPVDMCNSEKLPITEIAQIFS